MTYKKQCKICGCDFIGTGPAAMYCDVHKAERAEHWKKYNREQVARVRAANGKIQKPGVGKGGNPNLLKKNPNYKHGFYVAERQRREIKQRGFCERCGKDLRNADRWSWCVHHKDHNHCNHDYDNLELLCKRCHQIEHDCFRAFSKRATTIPQGSTPKQAEKLSTLKGDDIVSSA